MSIVRRADPAVVLRLAGQELRPAARGRTRSCATRCTSAASSSSAASSAARPAVACCRTRSATGCTWIRGRAEEARLRQIFGESYRRYCAQVRRFVPACRSRQPVATWSWKLFRQNHGPLNLALTLVCGRRGRLASTCGRCSGRVSGRRADRALRRKRRAAAPPAGAARWPRRSRGSSRTGPAARGAARTATAGVARNQGCPGVPARAARWRTRRAGKPQRGRRVGPWQRRGADHPRLQRRRQRLRHLATLLLLRQDVDSTMRTSGSSSACATRARARTAAARRSRGPRAARRRSREQDHRAGSRQGRMRGGRVRRQWRQPNVAAAPAGVS